MGSGKTTLSRYLSHQLGWTLFPEGLRSRAYLADLFLDEKRWAFDTQISFLCEKALRLKKYIESNKNVILDRSIFEDVYIFANYFYDKGDIDERSYSTYLELAEYFIDDLPNPSLLVYCECSLSSIKSRVNRRKRDIDIIYPKGHLPSLYERYQYWFNNFNSCPVCKINSDAHDFRNRKVVKKISEEIISILANSRSSSNQLLLPGFSDENFTQTDYKYVEINIPVEKGLPSSKFKKSSDLFLSFPSAYIAAPFTSAATSKNSKNNQSRKLFDVDDPHGIIEKGSYRNILNEISSIMKRKKFSVVLPHRDINLWGQKILTPNDVFNLCNKYVEACDLFIGILGFSHGAHYEFGLAIGLDKPAIIFSPLDLEETFFAKGISSLFGNILHIKCDRLRDIPKILNSNQVNEFLDIYFPMEELR